MKHVYRNVGTQDLHLRSADNAKVLLVLTPGATTPEAMELPEQQEKFLVKTTGFLVVADPPPPVSAGHKE